MLGAGSLVAEDFTVPAGSVWVGSQEGSAVMVAPEDRTQATWDTTTSFGRAFYQGKAPYTVIPLWAVAICGALWRSFCTWYGYSARCDCAVYLSVTLCIPASAPPYSYRNCALPLSLVLASYLLDLDPGNHRTARHTFLATLVAFMYLNMVLSFAALVVDIVGKLHGRSSKGAATARFATLTAVVCVSAY